MYNKVPLTELNNRMNRFRAAMDTANPSWQIAVIFSKINQYYFTGTMQEGIVIIPREDIPVYWVRRSYERATTESLFENIKPMDSFKDAQIVGKLPDTVYLETEVVPMALYQRFLKYFPFESVKPLDMQIAAVRSIKSPYELDLIQKAGRIHSRVLEDLLPSVLKEGMSEADLCGELFSLLLKEGHHGVSRFGMFDTEMALGQLGFGENSIHPTYFNGPGGSVGISAAVPLLGSRERKLKKGDLVFVDVGCGYEGYHTDKTMTYMFGKPLPKEAIEEHNKCVDIQNRIAGMLVPGELPCNIYSTVINELSPEFLNNFMGFGNRRVKFLGHSIGLLIDELPVLAEGFKQPLQQGMVFAVEPKKGIAGVGMVGIENTFLVTPQGGHCLTGNNTGLILVD